MSRSALLKTWFGATFQLRNVWFGSTDEFVQELTVFKPVLENMMAKPNNTTSFEDCWITQDQSLDEAHALLADILCLDQLPRTFFKKTPAMYSCDEKASKLASIFLSKGLLEKLEHEEERLFVLLTMQHSEDVEIQSKSVEMHQQYVPKLYSMVGKYATSHARVVTKFKRFPHRNAILNRESTPEEVAHLTSAELEDWEK
jgi:uncharacterized protein (DUF924 family)